MGFFDVVNISGLVFAIALLVPHIAYAKTHTYDKSVISNRAMHYIDNIGRYCSLFLMAINIGVLEEGFTSNLMRDFWFVFTVIMLAVYSLLWILFFKKERKLIAYLLAVVSAVIVMMSGLLQVKTLLLTAGIVYLIGELYVLRKVFPKE